MLSQQYAAVSLYDNWDWSEVRDAVGAFISNLMSNIRKEKQTHYVKTVLPDLELHKCHDEL